MSMYMNRGILYRKISSTTRRFMLLEHPVEDVDNQKRRGYVGMRDVVIQKPKVGREGKGRGGSFDYRYRFS